ncbi:hypothetical protein F170042I7_18330 [Blautia caecimuris]
MTWKESGVMERFWKWKNFWLNKTVCIRLLIRYKFTVKTLCKLKGGNIQQEEILENPAVCKNNF